MRLDKKKRGFQLPHVIVILMCITLTVTVMSFLIPSGEFVRDANGAVDPTQFSYVENDNPITFFDFFYDIPHGIAGSADIIISIMVISGVLYVVEQTGAIFATLQRLTVVARGKEVFAVLGLTLVFGVLGVIGWGEDAFPFVPMVVSLALALGCDRVVGIAIVQLGVCIGLSTGAFNTSATGICQELAGVPIFTAQQFRLMEFVICYLTLALFLASYCRKIKRDPNRSVMPEFQRGERQEQRLMTEQVPMAPCRVLTLLAFVAALIIQVFGAIQLGQGMEQFSGPYVILAVTMAVINGISPSKACTDFIQGTTTVISVVIVVGVARAIYLLMGQAKIVGTTIHALANVFEGESPFVVLLLLYIFAVAFNFFVTSASDEAFILFPMLKPLADILGINQQAVVATFQPGDGFTNWFFPNSGLLMTGLEPSGVIYQQWVKFAAKIIGALVLTGLCFASPAQMIGLS